MIDQELIELIREFYASNTSEREETLRYNLLKTLNDLGSRRMLGSSIAGNRLGSLYANELKIRTTMVLEYVKKTFDKGNLTLPIQDLDQISDEIKKLIDIDAKRLLIEIKKKLEQMNSANIVKTVESILLSARNPLFSKINTELKFYLSTPIGNSKESKRSIKPTYVDEERIKNLKSITSDDFDLSKLIRLCEEINLSYQNECYMSIAMAVRSIINHVPPIFGFESFTWVVNNYGGTRSFKHSMKNLENSLRKIADAHLHVQIRKKEVLPTFTQVNFSQDLDVLLAEIIRILK